ncbi:hypothetical protein DR64_2025 [Paraburkholderia xenovorans LB400]|nr:hypothetical protein DR64_2025 [Paraburkholderia xenovorans LB400]
MCYPCLRTPVTHVSGPYTCRKESKQRKRLHTASPEAGPLAWRGQWCIWNPCSRTFRPGDKAVILPASRSALAGTVRFGTEVAFVRRGSRRLRLGEGLYGRKIEKCHRGKTARDLGDPPTQQTAKGSRMPPARQPAKGSRTPPAQQPAKGSEMPLARQTASGSRIVADAETAGGLRMEETLRGLRSVADARDGWRWMKYRDGARSAAGRMTALSPGRNVREHGFQMHHCLLQARGPASGLAV